MNGIKLNLQPYIWLTQEKHVRKKYKRIKNNSEIGNIKWDREAKW